MAEAQLIPEAFLEVIEPWGERTLTKIAKTPFWVGRSGDLALPDKRISRSAASIVCSNGTFRLEDFGQRRGIYVNGKITQSRNLQTGDRIKFGDSTLEVIFHLGQPQQRPHALQSQLSEDQKNREQEHAIDSELVIAHRVQQELLPRRFHQFPYVHVRGINRACLDVGGDYFDVMELSHDRMAFVIADISGKGLGAALMATMLQGWFSSVTIEVNPSRLFAQLNRFICEHTELERYSTLFFGELDSDGNLTFLNAGHCPPLLLRPSRAEPAMHANCLPLGLLRDAQFTAGSHKLHPRDTLVLYTDGVIDAEDTLHNSFTIERLQQIATQYVGVSVEELLAAILAALEDFRGGAEQVDDITLLILSYTGGKAAHERSI